MMNLFHVLKTPFKFALVMSAALVAAGLSAACADTIIAQMNKARIVRVDTPISQIVVGNPAMVSVNVLDAYSIAITGLVAGSTNLLILDSQANTQYSTNIAVTQESAVHNQVAVYRDGAIGKVRETLQCSTSGCAPILRAGDGSQELDRFQKTAKTIMEDRTVIRDAADFELNSQ